MNNKEKLVFITWGKYNSRVESLAKALGAEPIYIGKVRKNKFLLNSFFLYLNYAYQNIRILNKLKPNIIIIENTTWPVALVNFLYSKISGAKLVLDSHSCAFDYVFIKYPLFISKLFAKYSALSFVTNLSHYNILKEKDANVMILSDIPFENGFAGINKKPLTEKFNLCYICTFSYDEPYFELIKAAGKLSDVQVYITGNYPIVNINPDDYKHVIFTGYINNEEYRSLLKSVDAIITLTRNEDTMQRAGSEAVSVGKPLITSDTKMLRNYFTQGTVFVDNTVEGITEGIIKLKDNYDLYSSEILKFQENRKKMFINKLNEVKESLEIK
jgi:glycosyltransferase involved in cell wall biosynthesis